MKNIKNVWVAAAAALLLGALARVSEAAVVIYDQAIIDSSGLSIDTAPYIDLRAVGIGALSAQATYTSATVSAVTFTDGTQSTGSFTVLDNTALSSASASNNITVTENAGVSGARLNLPGYSLREGIDWVKRDVASNTAVSLKAALDKVPFLSVSRVGAVIYATAPYGSFWNSFTMASSTPTCLTVASAAFSGGADNAYIAINGIRLRQGTEWQKGASAAATATAIKNAINSTTKLSRYLSASSANGVIYATSTLAGTLYNFTLTTSSPTAISRVSATMTGGTNPATTLGSATIAKTAHGLNTGLAVLFTSSTVHSNNVPGNLTALTTYFAIRVDADNFKLASTKPNALAGTAITINSSTTQQTADTFTLTPLSIAGTPAFKWQVSNNNSSWSDLAVSSVTMLSYTNPATDTFWAFGYIGARYIRANIVAPSTGAISIAIRAVGTD